MSDCYDVERLFVLQNRYNEGLNTLLHNDKELAEKYIIPMMEYSIIIMAKQCERPKIVMF